MNYNVYYNGQETNNFDTLAGWFQEVYCKMLSLKEANKQLREANEQHRDDYIRLKQGYDESKICNRSLESDIDILKEENKILMAEREKINEVLKRYCGKYVTGPIPTIVGAIIDDYFYQKAETECQVKALQKAEKTIDKLNKELVEYADKVDDQRERIKELEEVNKNWEKKLWDPDWCRLIDKLNEMIDREAPIIYPSRKVYTNVEDEIWDKLNYLTRSLCFRNNLIRAKDKNIRRLENKVNELDVTNRKLKLENEKLIHVQGDNAIEHATEITVLKREISALKTELEERKNKRSPRWPSDVMRIGSLENKVDKLTEENEYLSDQIMQRNQDVDRLMKENRMLKSSQSWNYGMFVPSRAEGLNSIFGVNGTIHKLREENDKLKDALEFCQKEASSAREHAHNVEVNAERIRKGLD